MDGKKPFILKRKKVPRIKAMQDGVLLEKMRITNEDIVKVIADSALMYVRLAAVRASYLGAPSTIRTRDFQNALGYEIYQDERGRYSFKITLEYDDRWSWVNIYLETNERPFPMKWLTKERQGKRHTIPIMDKETGKMIFRQTPLTTKNAWIHPGIKKGVWVEEGIAKGVRRSLPKVAKMMKAQMMENKK